MEEGHLINMNLKCKINNKEFSVVVGNTITDNYNETLDSGAIILDHIEKQDFKPFDDVYIYDGDFNGVPAPFRYDDLNVLYEEVPQKAGSLTLYVTNFYLSRADAESATEGGYFLYKVNNSTTKLFFQYVNGEGFHLRIEETQEEAIVQMDEQNRYGIGGYIHRYSGLTPKIIYCIKKVKQDAFVKPSFYRHFLIDDFQEERLNLNENAYKYKINLMSEIKAFEKIQLPNTSITQPLNIDKKVSVYDYIVQFVNMYSKKRKYQIGDTNEWIEIQKYSVDESLKDVFGDVYAPDFSLNNPTLKDVLAQLFLTKDRIPYVEDNVVKALDITKRVGAFNAPEDKVNYIESSMSSSNYAQNLKRNYNNGLSQDNSAHLTEFLGFRNTDNGLMTLGNMRIETRFPIYKINKVYMCYYKKVTLKNQTSNVETQMMFLCKQDITKLVLLNEQRNLLSQDWEDFTEDDVPQTIEDLAKYKLATVGYDMGNNYIEGWGTKYSYVPDYSWFTNTKSYIENIFLFMDRHYPLGINSYNFIKQQQTIGNQVIVPTASIDNIIAPLTGGTKLKSFFFMVDYNAFYNGTVIHSKDNNFGDLCDNDNPSSSLTLLESDGLFEKEKINRLGNKIMRINARYTSINEIQPLGSVFEDDYIVYSRTISIYPNFINVNYTLTKDYVLRSYFTSVWAKIRTYNLLSYSESILRAENNKVFLMLSKDESYSANDYKINFTTSLDINTLLCSAFIPSRTATSKNYYENDYKLNTGYFAFNGENYESDINSFVSGYSLCFNIQMADNVSSGVYIKYPSPTFNMNAEDEDKKTGSGQSWYLMVDDTETGKLQKVGVYFAHINQEKDFLNTSTTYSESDITELYNELLFKLPKNTKIDSGNIENKIGQTMIVNKDNKEQLDFTFQIEPITRDNNIYFSQWFMKLNDLLGNYQKVQQTYSVEDTTGADEEIDLYATTDADILNAQGHPEIFMYITPTQLANLKVGSKVTAIAIWDQPSPTHIFDPMPNNFQITFNKIIAKTEDSITFDCSLYYRSFFNTKVVTEASREITLTKSKSHSTGDDRTLLGFQFINFKVPKGSGDVIGDLYNGYKLMWRNVEIFADELPSASNCQIIPLYIDVDTIVQTTTYNQNMFVYGQTDYFNENLVYKELSENEITNGYTKVDIDISSLFNVRIDETTNKPYIYIDLSLVPTDLKSIGYWFKNESSNSYNFVFGVNITDEDRTNAHVKIYLSLLNNNVLEVYDKNNNLIGRIHNFASDNENYYYKQLFDSII